MDAGAYASACASFQQTNPSSVCDCIKWTVLDQVGTHTDVGIARASRLACFNEWDHLRPAEPAGVDLTPPRPL